MKNTFLFAFIFCVGISSAFSQTKIAVAIAQGKTSCTNVTDLGYQIYSGSASVAELTDKAVAAVKKSNPSYTSIAKEKNGWNGDSGNHLVIIEAKTKYQGCDKYTYGIGFGEDFDEAEDNAVKNLKIRNWAWSESKHGYDIEYEKRF